ncbi:UNVERIFIED_CONTAM: hypothetical protein FKN15_078290 [Acipenser sinensis]
MAATNEAKRTARFEWNGPFEEEMPERENFIEMVIFGLLKIKPEHILGIQRNGKEKFFDVAMKGEFSFKMLLDKCKEEKENDPLSHYKVESRAKRNHRLLTINMFDMNMSSVQVELFLSRYVKILSPAIYRRDRFGIWNGQRQYHVLLKEDEEGFQGLVHPPAYFKIEGVKGYILYSGQPWFCRRCQEFGHPESTCTRMKCLNCNEMGHFSSNCPKPKTCNKCGATDHLFRNCPNEKKTYARAAQACEDEDVVATVIQKLRALVPPAVQKDKAEGMGTPSDSALLEGCNVVSGEVEEAGRMEEEDSNGTQEGTIIPDTIVPGTSASWGEKMEAEDEKEGRWSIAKAVGEKKIR